MKVFTSTDHEAFYVGGASVVIAESEAEARELLTASLNSIGLPKRPEHRDFTLQEVDISKPQAIVLHDGDY
jgi:hypothetical protein